MEAIKIAALHLEGEAHDWWFHGISTLGNANVTTYSDFTRRLVERCDRRDLEEAFNELAKLKKSGNPETYIYEFIKQFFMVLVITKLDLIGCQSNQSHVTLSNQSFD